MGLKNELGIIIQARTGSKRLPNKMILPFFKELGLLELLLIRLIKADLTAKIVVATTVNSKDNTIEELGNKYGLNVFRGSEENVLMRFVQAAELYQFDKIIRVCADNPLLDVYALKYLLESFSGLNVDYWCYSIKDKTPTIKTHFGFWGEGVKLSALKKVLETTNNSQYLEHVTNFIYENPNLFDIYFEPISEQVEMEDFIRLTVDTYNDFQLLKKIYSEIISKGIVFKAEKITRFVKQNPKWIISMKNEILVNKK